MMTTSLKATLLVTLFIFATNNAELKANSSTYETVFSKQDLIRLYDESKMKRDLYRTLSKRWSDKSFLKLEQQSEKELEKIVAKMKKRGMTIPSKKNGKFNLEITKGMYEELLKQAGISYDQAKKISQMIDMMYGYKSADPKRNSMFGPRASL